MEKGAKPFRRHTSSRGRGFLKFESALAPCTLRAKVGRASFRLFFTQPCFAVIAALSSYVELGPDALTLH
eukprot:2820770-Amphidinium_carterae.1